MKFQFCSKPATVHLTRIVDQHLLKHELVKRLHARYAQEGITTPLRTRTGEIAGGGVVARR